MRNLKRFLAMALSVLMVAGSFAAVSAKEFTDVEADNDYAVAIDKLSDLGVIQGKDDDSYAPSEELTRWHMALFLARLDSGRMEDEDTLRLWYEATNYTPFADLAGDYPVAAINYVYNYDMIVGTSATTFSPDAGIMYQDALTMVVRALDYGSDAMDAGYPWKYINKANELGLTDGIDASVLYTDTLNRGEMAQVLYNALYAVDVEGNTYAEKYMGQTTVVITGVKDYRIAAVEPVRIANYVSVNVMNANGTINTDVTYFLPVSEFGYEEATKALVGMSFKVNTSDNFVTLDTVDPCEYAEFGPEDFAGATGNATKDLTINGVAYKVVDSYSFLYNTQTTTSVGTSKDGSNEILFFGYFNANTDVSEDFQYDANYNILDAKGEIVAYYVPAITGSYDAPYAAKLADGVYVPFVDTYYLDDEDELVEYSWEQAIKDAMKGNEHVISQREYAPITDTRIIASTDRFSSIAAYDDDVDGLYERAFYNYWSFGYIAPVANTNPVQYTINGTNYGTNVKNEAVDAEGNAVAFANNYVRWTRDAVTGQVTIDKVYEWVEAGKVLGVNGQSFTTTLGTYNATGIANYPNAAALTSKALADLYGYNASVITETDDAGNEIVLVVKKTDVTNYTVILDDIVAINTNGYVKMTMINVANGQKIVADVATVKGYEYNEFVLLEKLYGVYEQLASGQMWSATLDNKTNLWHLTATAVAPHVIDPATGTIGFDQYTYAPLNMVANAVSAGSIAELVGIRTAASTVLVVIDQKGTMYANVGALAHTVKISVEESKISYAYTTDSKTGVKTLTYMIVDMTGDADATCEGISLGTVVYMAANTGWKIKTNDDPRLEVIGQIYEYTGLYTLTGSTVDTTIYNTKLEVGKFYVIVNGYVEKEYVADSTPATKDDAVVAANNNLVTVIKADGSAFVSNAGTWYVREGKLAYEIDQQPILDAIAKEQADAAAKDEAAKEAAAKAVVWEALWDVVSYNGESATELAILETKLEAALAAATVEIGEVEYLEAKLAMEKIVDKAIADVTVDDVNTLAALAPEAAAELALIAAYACEEEAYANADKKWACLELANEFYALLAGTTEWKDNNATGSEATTVAERMAEITKGLLFQSGAVAGKLDSARVLARTTGWDIQFEMKGLSFAESVAVNLLAGEKVLTTVELNTEKYAAGKYSVLTGRICVTDTDVSSSWIASEWTPSTAEMPTAVELVIDGYVMNVIDVVKGYDINTGAPIALTAADWALVVANILD